MSASAWMPEDCQGDLGKEVTGDDVHETAGAEDGESDGNAGAGGAGTSGSEALTICAIQSAHRSAMVSPCSLRPHRVPMSPGLTQFACCRLVTDPRCPG
jgi:hypothetical protein